MTWQPKWIVCAIALLGLTEASRATELSSREVSARVDRMLANELAAEAKESAESSGPAPQADDVSWLRRIYLDVIGELPTPEEITAFGLDASPDKREQVVERLLADERYGRNWGRYWRDVILFRRTDERALLAAESVASYLAEQFNQGASWEQIAQDFVTAKGELADDGRTALIASQWGEVPETAAEVSRVLMGVQIQCAQCHDHKTDRWKRDEFHQLAAFFPRIGIRRIIEEDGKRRGFVLYSKDDNLKKKPKVVNVKLAKRIEHYMPDLEDPSADGTLMQPVFFLSGQQLEPGLSDAERRQQLADWITSSENPWFARAFVNRIWSEMVGEGFYEPVDDIGPDKDCTAPKTLEFLSQQFIEHDYDLKWLVRAIAATEVYGRESRQRRTPSGAPFVAACPQPLRADQIFNNLSNALELADRGDKAAAGVTPEQVAARARGSARGQFLAKFGYDPSNPRDEHASSIDQALALMNTPAIAQALSARGQGKPTPTLLARLLDEYEDDQTVIEELYLRCLAREPSDREIATCRDYVKEVGNRTEAFEDILWSLVNSTEFLYRD